MPSDAQKIREELAAATVRIDNYRFPWLIFSLVIVVFFLLFGVALYGDLTRPGKEIDAGQMTGLAAAGLFGSTLYSFMIVGGYYQIKKARLDRARQSLFAKLINEETRVLQQELQQDFFTNLVQINFKYIDKYYLQTQLQADKSFRITATVSIVGFMFILAGVTSLHFGTSNNAGSVTVGAGVISEFIAAIFFYLYNSTIAKMGDYHQKLVLTQNASLAIKIADGLPDAVKAEAQRQLIDYLAKDINVYLGTLNNRSEAK